MFTDAVNYSVVCLSGEDGHTSGQDYYSLHSMLFVVLDNVNDMSVVFPVQVCNVLLKVLVYVNSFESCPSHFNFYVLVLVLVKHI